MMPTSTPASSRRLHQTLRAAALAAVLAPALAFASVGKVSVLEGKATRTPKDGAAEALKVGSEIELADVINVEAGGNLKLALSDESVLMVGGGSKLTIEEGRFESLEHRSFVARLGFGKAWAKVTKALSGSDAKFEVKTERAVAGVRGTIFRVDTERLLTAVRPGKAHTTVKVDQGKVAVEASFHKTVAAADKGTQPASGPGPAVKKAHVQVAGPKQVSKDQWEKQFAELQEHQQISIGEELTFKAEPYDSSKDHDAFAQFIQKNQ